MSEVIKKRYAAIVLAAGSGKRMQSPVQKQYMLIHDKPLIYYTIKAFEESFVDEIILVCGKNEIDYCRTEIVDYYGFQKVTAIVEGGKERYHSVAAGLNAIDKCDYVFIHDGARPFVKQEMLLRAKNAVTEHGACIVGMPVKDTIKVIDENGMIDKTPDRNSLFVIQTPQCFERELIDSCYKKLIEKEQELSEQGIKITDDAMVVEYFTSHPIKLVEGDYCNIKVTTPEDLLFIQNYL